MGTAAPLTAVVSPSGNLLRSLRGALCGSGPAPSSEVRRAAACAATAAWPLSMPRSPPSIAAVSSSSRRLPREASISVISDIRPEILARTCEDVTSSVSKPRPVSTNKDALLAAGDLTRDLAGDLAGDLEPCLE